MNYSGTDKNRTLFVGNVDYAKERTLVEIDGYLRSLFTAFGDIEGVSVSETKQLSSSDNANADDDQNNEIVLNCFESRFAHIVFSKKISLKNALASSDSAFYDLTKIISQVRYEDGEKMCGENDQCLFKFNLLSN